MEQMEPIELVMGSSQARFAVVETLPNEHRILCLTDDEAEASEIALELRRRGIRAVAHRTRAMG
jgi:predicted nucleic acid-binding protein